VFFLSKIKRCLSYIDLHLLKLDFKILKAGSHQYKTPNDGNSILETPHSEEGLEEEKEFTVTCNRTEMSTEACSMTVQYSCKFLTFLLSEDRVCVASPFLDPDWWPLEPMQYVRGGAM
jgi:hypothetical protein